MKVEIISNIFTFVLSDAWSCSRLFKQHSTLHTWKKTVWTEDLGFPGKNSGIIMLFWETAHLPLP